MGDESNLRDGLCNRDLPAPMGRGWSSVAGEDEEEGDLDPWRLRALTSWNEGSPDMSAPDSGIPCGVQLGLSQRRAEVQPRSPHTSVASEGLDERAFIYSHVCSFVNEKMLLPHQ